MFLLSKILSKFTEGKIVPKYTLNCAMFYQHSLRRACLQTHLAGHDYNLSLFWSFLRQNRNKTSPKLTKLRSHEKKIPGSMLSNNGVALIITISCI